MNVTVRQEENRIHLAISDNGKGMTEEQVSRAFDRYYTSGQKNSTGLGLSISAAIIHGHHGQISLHSQPGEGVQVSIVLPTEQLNAVNADETDA